MSDEAKVLHEFALNDSLRYRILSDGTHQEHFKGAGWDTGYPDEDFATAACNELFRLVSARRWIPSSERLPDENRTVLAFGPAYITINIGWWNGEAWRLFGAAEGSSHYGVTHWMPLPEPPKP